MRINGFLVAVHGPQPELQRGHLPPNRPEMGFRNKAVFIGNAVKYSSWALLSLKSKVPDYLVGTSANKSMKAKIDRFFSDKRPDIRVGSDIRFRAFHEKRLEKE